MNLKELRKSLTPLVTVKVGSRFVKFPMLDLDLVLGMFEQKTIFKQPAVISTYKESIPS
jgi:hypothetical protein